MTSQISFIDPQEIIRDLLQKDVYGESGKLTVNTDDVFPSI